ncbi:sigma-70 family RNA polymerase sigma factor [Planctomycetota bacterium]
MTDVTRILNAIEGGDEKATNELLPLVYEELRVLAAQKLSHEKPGQTLQATALVHEAYMRLVGNESQGWNGRGHFFGAAAEAMRRILVESARRKMSKKRGGDNKKEDLVEACFQVSLPPHQIIDVNDALSTLEKEEPEVAHLVKLRYFVGLPMEQAAEILNISLRTAYRNWAFARARLSQELADFD